MLDEEKEDDEEKNKEDKDSQEFRPCDAGNDDDDDEDDKGDGDDTHRPEIRKKMKYDNIRSRSSEQHQLTPPVIIDM